MNELIEALELCRDLIKSLLGRGALTKKLDALINKHKGES